MSERRIERQRQQRREALERAMDLLEAGGDPFAGGGSPAGLPLRRFSAPEELFFHDHGELLEGMGEALERVGLAEACLAWARHLEEDREHWLRRLELAERTERLRARGALLDLEWQELFAAHFRRWGAAGRAGERSAGFEAAALLGALRCARRVWVQGGGRPVLSVLVHEALALLWPALYPHQRRHR